MRRKKRMELATIKEKIKAVRENINKVIIGKDSVIDLILTAVIAGGHILLEDVPGTGKTVMAKALAKSIDSEFSRIQFTPDLLPSDITGLNYFNQKEGEFVFRKGRYFVISCWQTRSIARRREPSPACWNVWRRNR